MYVLKEPTVILSACRTPIGSFGGSLRDVPASKLGAIVIREAIARADIDPATIGDVIMGCVLQAGAGMNVARQAALEAGVPKEIPSETVNRVCGSGLQAVVHAVEAMQTGYIDVAVAGGTESMSRAPYLLDGARWGYRMGNAEVSDSILDEGLTCAIEGCHMGMTAERIVECFGISRAEQDAFAAESQQRAERAILTGDFRDEIVAVEITKKTGESTRFEIDEHPRRKTTVETLATLKPAFKKGGSVTAGNASGINDGAAALVVTTAARARQLERTPLAHVRDGRRAAGGRRRRLSHRGRHRHFHQTTPGVVRRFGRDDESHATQDLKVRLKPDTTTAARAGHYDSIAISRLD